MHAADGSRSAFQCSTARRVCSSVPLYLRISVPAKFEASSQSQYWMSAITPKRNSGRPAADGSELAEEARALAARAHAAAGVWSRSSARISGSESHTTLPFRLLLA